MARHSLRVQHFAFDRAFELPSLFSTVAVSFVFQNRVPQSTAHKQASRVTFPTKRVKRSCLHLAPPRTCSHPLSQTACRSLIVVLLIRIRRSSVRRSPDAALICDSHAMLPWEKDETCCIRRPQTGTTVDTTAARLTASMNSWNARIDDEASARLQRPRCSDRRGLASLERLGDA